MAAVVSVPVAALPPPATASSVQPNHTQQQQQQQQQCFNFDGPFLWHSSNPHTNQLVAETYKTQWTFGTPWWSQPQLGLASNSSIILLLGDSHAMSYVHLLSKYAHSAKVLFTQATTSNGSNKTKYNMGRVLSAPEWFLQFKHKVVFVTARSVVGLDKGLFSRYFLYWTEQGACVVLLADHPDLEGIKPTATQCIRSPKLAENDCRLDQKAVLSGVDMQYFRELLEERPELKHNTDIVDLNDLICWNGTCNVHIHDVPIWRDVHLSQQFIDFAHPYWVARIKKSKCIRRLEAHVAEEER